MIVDGDEGWKRWGKWCGRGDHLDTKKDKDACMVMACVISTSIHDELMATKEPLTFGDEGCVMLDCALCELELECWGVQNMYVILY